MGSDAIAQELLREILCCEGMEWLRNEENLEKSFWKSSGRIKALSLVWYT